MYYTQSWTDRHTLHRRSDTAGRRCVRLSSHPCDGKIQHHNPLCTNRLWGTWNTWGVTLKPWYAVDECRFKLVIPASGTGSTVEIGWTVTCVAVFVTRLAVPKLSCLEQAIGARLVECTCVEGGEWVMLVAALTVVCFSFVTRLTVMVAAGKTQL